MLLVSFAAPLANLTIMEKDGTSKRQIAATLAGAAVGILIRGILHLVIF